MVRELLQRVRRRHPEERMVAPHVTVKETEKELVLLADMPGVRKEDIQVSLNPDELVISGKRHEEVPKDCRAVYTERTPWNYRRAFAVHTEVEHRQMKALYENGVLCLTMPKSEKVKPKRIPVQ